MKKNNQNFWGEALQRIGIIIAMGFTFLSFTIITIFNKDYSGASILLYLPPFLGLLFMVWQAAYIKKFSRNSEESDDKKMENKKENEEDN